MPDKTLRVIVIKMVTPKTISHNFASNGYNTANAFDNFLGD